MTRLLAALSLLAVPLIATPALAATDPAAKCIAARLKVAGKEIKSVLKCHAKAAKTGTPVDAACVGKARDKAAAKLAKATTGGGCPATLPDDDAHADYVAARAAVIGGALLPGSASTCQSSKLKAAGKRAQALLKAGAKHAKKPNAAKVMAAVSKAEDKFVAAFLAADAGGGCTATGDAVEVAGDVDALVYALAGRLKLVTRETVTLASPVEPPNTPGSPAVPLTTNPKLIAQFAGTAAFSLNNVTYTRWRLGGPAQQPDAIFIVVPGFGGGAGNFEALAENLIARTLGDHGLITELWGYDRRTEQLEDREGALLAGALQDPLVALDWYYGGELGLTLHPALAGGPNRRAVFYNTTSDIPFLANWTPLTFSRDIDVVVQAARAAARNQNVFLGGHSAGTGFAARYAATDFNLTGVGPADPGYARLRGVVLFEGTGGSTSGAPLTSDSLDRIEAKFDGGLYGAVGAGAARCVDGVTPCAVASEAVDCNGQTPPICTPATAAHGVILGISPKILAAAEPAGVQGVSDPDGGQAIIQVDQGAPGNNAVTVVPELVLLSVLPAGTVEGLFGSFLDDESLTASLSLAIATATGAPGPVVGGLLTWAGRDEQALWPTCPGATCVLPNNGPAPTALPGGLWGQEVEAVRMDRLRGAFAGLEGANASDWYYPISGLSTTSAAGACSAGTCIRGNVGAGCTTDSNCNQAISLDSSALSIGRGRRDIENLTQAASIDIPLLNIGGSNGLVPVAGRFTALAQSLGPCTAPSCNGAARVPDPLLPNPAFPTFGGVDGGFEVVIAEGYSHVDVVAAEDDASNPVVSAVANFIARNAQ